MVRSGNSQHRVNLWRHNGAISRWPDWQATSASIEPELKEEIILNIKTGMIGCPLNEVASCGNGIITENEENFGFTARSCMPAYRSYDYQAPHSRVLSIEFANMECVCVYCTYKQIVSKV